MAQYDIHINSAPVAVAVNAAPVAISVGAAQGPGNGETATYDSFQNPGQILKTFDFDGSITFGHHLTVKSQGDLAYLSAEVVTHPNSSAGLSVNGAGAAALYLGSTATGGATVLADNVTEYTELQLPSTSGTLALVSDLAPIAQAANTAASDSVPKTTTVNNKELSGNIILTASDVGASASGHGHAFSAMTDIATSAQIPTTLAGDRTFDATVKANEVQVGSGFHRIYQDGSYLHFKNGTSSGSMSLSPEGGLSVDGAIYSGSVNAASLSGSSLQMGPLESGLTVSLDGSGAAIVDIGGSAIQLSGNTGGITAQSIALGTPLAVADGGTGATSVDAARTNLGLGVMSSPTFAGLSASSTIQTTGSSTIGGVAGVTLNLAGTGGGRIFAMDGNTPFVHVRQSTGKFVRVGPTSISYGTTGTAPTINMVMDSGAFAFDAPISTSSTLSATGLATLSGGISAPFLVNNSADYNTARLTASSAYRDNFTAHVNGESTTQFVMFGGNVASGSSSGFATNSSGVYAWSNNNSLVSNTKDLILRRDAGSTLAQRNGTNAQTSRIYNTYTSTTSYERGKFEWPLAIVTGNIAIGTANLNVTAVTQGTLETGMTISGTGVTTGTTIVSQASGTTGGIGVYVVSNVHAAAVASTTINAAANVLRIGTEKGATGGMARDLQLQTDGVTRMTIGSGGDVTISGSATLSGGYILGQSTVAGLPAASANARRRYEVTNATSPTLGSTVTGGGSTECTVRSNGTNWVVIQLF